MRHQGPGRAELGALELMDEAVHLLRRAPWVALATYYLGGLPFGLAFLYFWADLSRGSGARERLGSWALEVALLFLWMKVCQAMFVRQLQAHITGRPAGWSLACVGRVMLIQTIVQPSGLFVLVPALGILFPFGYVYAFYQNVTALAAGEGARVGSVVRRALRQTGLWPGQNHWMLAILFLFGSVVFLDVAVGLAQVPALLKMLFGIETASSSAPMSLLNTTFLAAAGCLTYLCLDPLVKAAYALRCFYGESLQSGEDLKADLKAAVGGLRAVVLAGAMILLAVPARAAAAGDGAVPPVTAGKGGGDGTAAGEIPPPALDRSIDRVLERRQYDWRLPREKVAGEEKDKGFFVTFMDSVVKTAREWAKAVLTKVRDLMDWLEEKLRGRRRDRDVTGPGRGWFMAPNLMIYGLLGVVLAVAAIFLHRAFGRRRAGTVVAGEVVVLSQPDLADEGIVASQLPEDEWLRLARESMGRGELRAALRAFYLAGLAHLAQRELISVAKYKSNRDYQGELRRRARALPELQAAFGENVWDFERVWYGRHEANRETLDRFQLNLDKVRAC